MDPDHLCPPLDETEGAELAPELAAFFEGFGPRGFQGRVCDRDYQPFFSDAVGVVRDACDGYSPPEARDK